MNQKSEERSLGLIFEMKTLQMAWLKFLKVSIKYFGLQSQDDEPNKNLPPSQQANAKVKKE